MSALDKDKVVNAVKWSAITEVMSKLVSPISTMVLARLLTPEAFGVVATITMIVSFAEIFTDAGFQKYLVQHEFTDEKDREESTCVAFWSNLILSVILWSIIIAFCEPLAKIVGNPGLGHVIGIACISIPLQAFSSIQMALYKRDFDFKTLFKVRLLGVFTPLTITIPLAIWMRSYWALVCGTIALNLVNAIVLTYYSNWKIRAYYSFSKLKAMFTFTSWSMIESILLWMTGYFDIFIVGIHLNEYLLGIYKTSMNTVGQITAIVTSATTPVLFSSLSRLQSNPNSFKEVFFKFQKLVGMLVIPLGVGIFVFRDFITSILLGNQWALAANFIGLFGLISTVAIVLSHYSSEVYRSLGKPKLSALSQFLYIIVLCPAMIWAVQYNFDIIYITRSLIRIEAIIVNLIIMHLILSISPQQMIGNVMIEIVASIVMGISAYWLLNINNSIFGTLIAFFASVCIYFVIIISVKQERNILLSFWRSIKK